jgi:DNA mismatch endonuclease (patch repair protein)
MSDVHNRAQRSFNMSRIRGRDTKPEVRLRKALWRIGLRYRKSAKLPGRPDITFINARTVVFVDGCFWHGCPQHMTWPKSNREFWSNKISGNIARDQKVNNLLSEQGWKVIRVWEHELEGDFDACIKRITSALAKQQEKRQLVGAGQVLPPR